MSLQSRLTHSKRLLPAIDWLLRETRLDWEGIAGIAASLGPGSFTGLRIGLSTAKGLTLAAGKPLLGVPALDGLAWQFCRQPHQICALADARKNEVYAALYRPEGSSGEPRRTSDYMVLTPATLAEKITEPTILAGSGLVLYQELLRNTLGNLALIPPPELHFPRAAGIGLLALALWRRKEFLDPASAAPLYIRASDAERALHEKQAGSRARP